MNSAPVPRTLRSNAKGGAARPGHEPGYKTNAGRMAVDAGFIGVIFGPAGRLSRERDQRAQRAMKPAYGKIVWSWRPVAGAKSLW